MFALLLAAQLWIPQPADGGRVLVSPAPENTVAEVWDLGSGELLMSQPLGLADYPYLTPNGRTLIIRGEHEDGTPLIKAWDVETQQLIDSLYQWGTDPPHQIYFDPEFVRLIFTWRDGRMQVHERETRRLLNDTIILSDTSGPFNKVALSPDRNTLALFREGELLVWDLSRDRPVVMPWDLGMGVFPIITTEKGTFRCGAIHSEYLTGLHFLDRHTLRMSIRCSHVYEVDLSQVINGAPPPVRHIATFNGQIALKGGGRLIQTVRGDQTHLLTLAQKTHLATVDEDAVIGVAPGGGYWVESDPTSEDWLVIRFVDGSPPCKLDRDSPEPCPQFIR